MGKDRSRSALDAAGTAALEERRITLAPGQKETFRIDRLVTGTREKPRALYWTEAGQYTVEILLRVARDKGKQMAEHRLLGVEWIERQSTREAL